MRAKKIDLNQPEIVEGLRAMGASVTSLAPIGAGCPDLLVGWKGRNLLMEVKQEQETFTAPQKLWHKHWQGSAHVVRSIAEAIQVLGSYR